MFNDWDRFYQDDRLDENISITIFICILVHRHHKIVGGKKMSLVEIILLQHLSGGKVGMVAGKVKRAYEMKNRA